MSDNEIELTFVRCQNCKSLMPSTAQACGMCGHQRVEASENKSKLRLRQNSEVDLENKEDDVPSKLSDSSNDQQEDEKDYSRESYQTKKEDVLEKERRPFRFSSDQKSDEEKVDNNKFSFKTASDSDQSDEYDNDDHDGGEYDDFDSSESQEEDQPRGFDEGKDPQDIRPKRKRRRRKKKSVQRTLTEPDSRDVAPPPSFTPQARGGIQARPESNLKDSQEEIDMDTGFQNKKNVSEVSPRRDLEEGRLVGWLVNYSTNGRGTSFELRVGRRFIGRQALRAEDLVIQDSALSTPHSLLHVDGNQVFLQDLMSENGTFVKKQGSGEFLRKEASSRLLHGDVVRLGSYELIVCLIPS